MANKEVTTKNSEVKKNNKRTKKVSVKKVEPILLDTAGIPDDELVRVAHETADYTFIKRELTYPKKSRWSLNNWRNWFKFSKN